MANNFGVTFSESGDSLLASVAADSSRSQFDVDALRGLLAEAGYGHWFVSDAALATLVERYNSSSSAFELPVAERRDGSFSVEISADAMTAWVDFVPACGGTGVRPEEILAALGELGVVCGIDERAVISLCSTATPARIAAAKGVAPEHGLNTRFEALVPDARDRVPQVNERGLVDFRDLGAIPLVEAEQALMRRIPPTKGIAGRNVRGETIEPLPGCNEAFAEHLLGAYVAPDDSNLLRAVFNGQPVRFRNGVTVEQVLNVSDVNLTTGNISFDGTVNVSGEVSPGMKVSATGDIMVSGVVDGGELDAGGDIRIGGGVIAKARVRAGGSVAARFVEGSHIYAGTTIAIDDTALQSDLQAMNQIFIGLKSTQRGRLAGGSTRAMLLIQVPVLGAATGGVTGIQLGVNPVLEAKYEDLLQRIEQQKANEANLEKLIKHLSKQGDKSGTLERAKAAWQNAVQAWGSFLSEKNELEAQLTLINGARLEIGVGVTGAVDINFGKKALRLRRHLDAGVISMDGEKIIFTDSSGNASATV